MRNLATIQRISDLRSIEGADQIEVAQVLGWEVVVRKGEFTKGDLCVYCEIDSVLPEREEFEFLRTRKFRIKTIKLKKQVSQGIAFPVKILEGFGRISVSHEGQDVTELLGIVKYDLQLEAEKKLGPQAYRKPKNWFDRKLMKYRWYRNLTAAPGKRVFPEWIKKTDETRLQNTPRILERAQTGIGWTATEKLDGQSGTFFLVRRKGWRRLLGKFDFGVCSRNWQLIKEDTSSYWTIAKQYQLKERLEKVANAVFTAGWNTVVVQGEIIGNGIQKNKYQIEGYDLYIFNLIINGKQCPSHAVPIMLKPVGLKSVPIVKDNFRLLPTVKEMVEYSKGKSQVNDKVLREGIVVRHPIEDLSFKVINPDFLLKNDE